MGKINIWDRIFGGKARAEQEITKERRRRQIAEKKIARQNREIASHREREKMLIARKAAADSKSKSPGIRILSQEDYTDQSYALRSEADRNEDIYDTNKSMRPQYLEAAIEAKNEFGKDSHEFIYALEDVQQCDEKIKRARMLKRQYGQKLKHLDEYWDGQRELLENRDVTTLTSKELEKLRKALDINDLKYQDKESRVVPRRDEKPVHISAGLKQYLTEIETVEQQRVGVADVADRESEDLENQLYDTEH